MDKVREAFVRPGYKNIKNKRTGKVERTRVFHWVWYDKAGKRHEPYCRRQAEAQREADLKNKARLTGMMSDSGGRTMDDLFVGFLREAELDYEGGMLTYRTFSTYRGIVEKHLRPRLGAVPLDMDIVALAAECHAVLDDLLEVRPAGVANCGCVIKMSFDVGTRAGWLAVNPMIHSPSRRRARKPKLETAKVSSDELQLLFSVLSEGKPYRGKVRAWLQMRTVGALAFWGCMGAGEQQGLDWKNVHWEDGKLYVMQNWAAGAGITRTKTDARVRPVELVPEVRIPLAELWEFEGRPSVGLVFVTRKGRPLKNTSRDFGRFVKNGLQLSKVNPKNGRLVPKFNLHRVRAAGGSAEYQESKDMLRAQRKLGHAPGSKITAKHYLYLDGLEDRGVNERVNDGIRARLGLPSPAAVAPVVTLASDRERENRMHREQRRRRLERLGAAQMRQESENPLEKND
jgi:integrase